MAADTLSWSRSRTTTSSATFQAVLSVERYRLFVMANLVTAILRCSRMLQCYPIGRLGELQPVRLNELYYKSHLGSSRLISGHSVSANTIR